MTNRRGLAGKLGGAVLVAVSLGAMPASAGPKDGTAISLAERALLHDLGDVAARGKAQKTLEFATAVCGSTCGDQAKAQLALAQGIVHANARKEAEAKAAFDEARALDPDITLPEEHRDGPAGPLFGTLVAKPEPTEPPEPGTPPPEPVQTPAPTPKPKPKPRPPRDDRELDEPSPLTARLALEVSGYIDDNAVEVITPGFVFGLDDPINGWGINGSVLIDVVTAASPDIVSMASPKWQDERVSPTLGGHVKIGDWDLSLGGNLSIESDYRAYGANAGVSVELMNKQVVPSLGYSYGHDTAGRAGTPFDVYRLDLDRHGVVAGVTLVLDKATVLVPGATYVFETGRQEKPYRYLPVFAEGVEVDNGASIEQVNATRLPIRLEERLPDQRHRYAVSALLARRFKGFTLRISERLYRDSWEQMATTTDVRLPWDITKWFRLWPHLRFHGQTGTVFWQRAYRGQVDAAGVVQSLPTTRSGDRELGPLLGATGGLGIRTQATDALAFTLSGDVVYTRFLDHIYEVDRLAGFGVFLMEATID